MKKILKYLSVIIVVIAVSVAVYSISSSNDSVQMQNKEALAQPVNHMYIPCDEKTDEECEWDSGSRHHKLTNAVYTG